MTQTSDASRREIADLCSLSSGLESGPGECQREEIGPTRNKVASISDHSVQSVPHVASLMRAT
jgi:hypothetical protein